MTVWTFVGKGKKLEDIDLPRIGATIGVGEDELHAFMDVEAGGSGFDSKGRPKMLFEPHIFWRQLGPGKARDKAAAEGLAYAKWKKGGYPADSYPRLIKAMKINATLALMSCSWGLFQIMGFNHEAAGYASPEDMVRDFMDDEDNHVEAAVRFMISKKLDDDLRAHRWDVIERLYNGGGYGGAYARKMEKAFAKWRKIKDTPYNPGKVNAGAIEAPDLRQEAPPVVLEPGIHPTPEKPVLPPPTQPVGPTPTQVVATTAVVAAGAHLALGVPAWLAAGAGVLIVAIIAAFVIHHK